MQLHYEADKNVSVIIAAINKRLLYAIQNEWCWKAAGLLRPQRELWFEDLYEFVNDYIEIASAQVNYIGGGNLKSNISHRSDVQNEHTVPYT